MDPIVTNDAVTNRMHDAVVSLVKDIDPALSIHDFRMVDGKEQINLIFDMVVPFEYSTQKQNELKMTLRKLLQMADKRYQCVITIERSYVASAKG